MNLILLFRLFQAVGKDDVLTLLIHPGYLAYDSKEKRVRIPNEEAVVDAIVRVRDTNYAPMFYNNEQALRYVIKFAYIVCIDYYLKPESVKLSKMQNGAQGPKMQQPKRCFC